MLSCAAAGLQLTLAMLQRCAQETAVTAPLMQRRQMGPTALGESLTACYLEGAYGTVLLLPACSVPQDTSRDMLLLSCTCTHALSPLSQCRHACCENTVLWC